MENQPEVNQQQPEPVASPPTDPMLVPDNSGGNQQQEQATQPTPTEAAPVPQEEQQPVPEVSEQPAQTPEQSPQAEQVQQEQQPEQSEPTRDVEKPKSPESPLPVEQDNPKPKNHVKTAIFATVIIVICLAALAVYAYTKSNNS